MVLTKKEPIDIHVYQLGYQKIWCPKVFYVYTKAIPAQHWYIPMLCGFYIMLIAFNSYFLEIKKPPWFYLFETIQNHKASNFGFLNKLDIMKRTFGFELFEKFKEPAK